MSDLSSRSVCVIDHGIFVETAIRLARDFGKVYYNCPWQYGFSHVADAMVGQGFKEIEWCEDPYDPDFIRKVDLFVYPDVQHAGSQLLLESLGVPVWGTRKADSLELLREKFKKLQKKIGMEVPPYQAITGLSNLRAYLADHENVYVKISRYRGSMETWKHVNTLQSEHKLNQLAIEFGGVADQIPFIVEDQIEAFVEVGGDTYCIDGQFPELVMQGIEQKDQCFIGTLQKYEKLPDAVKEVNEFMAPVLESYRYRNFWSTEIRVTEDSTPYFIDPTCRQPSPAGESQLELYENLGEIMWEGAHGNLVQPEPTGEFAVQLLIEHHGEESDWRSLEIPDNVRQWVKLRYACKVEDHYEIVPQPRPYDPNIGWVVGIGDSIKEAIDKAKAVAEQLEGQNLTVHSENLVDVLKAIEEEESHGVEFTDKPVPEIESVL